MSQQLQAPIKNNNINQNCALKVAIFSGKKHIIQLGNQSRDHESKPILTKIEQNPILILSYLVPSFNKTIYSCKMEITYMKPQKRIRGGISIIRFSLSIVSRIRTSCELTQWPLRVSISRLTSICLYICACIWNIENQTSPYAQPVGV